MSELSLLLAGIRSTSALSESRLPKRYQTALVGYLGRQVSESGSLLAFSTE